MKCVILHHVKSKCAVKTEQKNIYNYPYEIQDVAAETFANVLFVLAVGVSLPLFL